MSIGIYISGLGQSANKESVEKYAARYVKELQYSTTGIKYDTNVEKIYYGDNQSSLVVRIYQQSKNDLKPSLLYSFYEFEYSELLNRRFMDKNLLLKNLALLLLVVRKFPRLIFNLFRKKTYIKSGQTIYMFLLFLAMSLAVLMIIPSIVGLAGNHPPELLSNLLKYFDNKYIEIEPLSKSLLSITSLLIIFIPESNFLLTKMADEFTTIDNYLQYGEQSQIIQGNLDALIEQIVENEQDPQIHLHTYSFGSIIALDALFPVGTEPCANITQNVSLLITVGAPYEFIDNYYPNFFTDRIDKMSDKIQWINVFSLMDAFASNFRNDNKVGKAHYGILSQKEIPLNINYEIARKDTFNPFSFLTLKHITMHKSYWDDSPSGQSCTRLIFKKMKELCYWENSLNANVKMYNV